MQPLHEEFTTGIARTLGMLAAAAGLVLLVALANVANLMLIRADARQNELALRATAGVPALLVVHVAVRALVRFGPDDIPRLPGLGVGMTTVGLIALVTLVSVFLCATLPALQLRRTSWSANLHAGARGESVSRSRQRQRMGVASRQITLALVVSVGSALLLRSAHRLNVNLRPTTFHRLTSPRTLARFSEELGMERSKLWTRCRAR